MRKVVRRKIRTTRSEYDGVIYTRNPTLRAESGEIASATARRKGALDDRLSAAREWAGKVLREAGLPDTLRTVQGHRDGTWTELPMDFWKAVDGIPDGESIRITNVLTMVYAQEPATDMPGGWESWSFEEITAYFESVPAPPIDLPAAVNGRELSPEWLACQLLERADGLEAAIAAGNTQRAALSGIELSDSWHNLILTEKYEIPIIVGLAQMKSGVAGGKIGGRPGTPEAVIADIQNQADAIWRVNPGKSVAATAAAVKNRHGLSLRTVRRYIKKPVEALKK